jgi:hypothetical protein
VGGKSTLNRLELSRPLPTRYHKISHDGAAIEALFVALFLEAHGRPPKQIVLDLDATDDPLYGHQEGRFFHGYYDCYCYLPLYVFPAGIFWRPGALEHRHSAGAVEEVARIIGQIRARWPRTRILLPSNGASPRQGSLRPAALPPDRVAAAANRCGPNPEVHRRTKHFPAQQRAQGRHGLMRPQPKPRAGPLASNT